jgi:RHS repeat-associated protein
VKTVHIWDGENICAETDGNGAVQGRYYRGVDLIARRQGGKGQYYLFNAHGDVVGLTDGSGQYEYGAFGVEKGPVAGDANPFRFAGEYFDKETGTYYLRARSYLPTLGRFTQEDSARDGLNWYTYCGNDPIGYVDPSGHWINIAGGGLIGGTIGFGINVFSQLAGNGWNFNAINMRSAWSAFGAGAITGAMAGATLGASLLGSAALAAVTSGALISGMGYASYNVFNGSRGTLGGLGGSMAFGGLTSGAMYGLSNIGTRPIIPDVHYNPLNQGPLPVENANSFRSSTYIGSVSQHSKVLYRSYGGVADELGSYWTDVKPLGPTQAMLDGAILPKWGNPATNISAIRMPPGVPHYHGIAGPQGNMVGGGNQVYFHNYQVPKSWLIKNPFGFTWGLWKYW